MNTSSILVVKEKWRFPKEFDTWLQCDISSEDEVRARESVPVNLGSKCFLGFIAAKLFFNSNVDMIFKRVMVVLRIKIIIASVELTFCHLLGDRFLEGRLIFIIKVLSVLIGSIIFSLCMFLYWRPFLYFFCGQRMNTTLSSLKEKVNSAQCPLPLFTCLHVKPDVSELMFAGM